MKSEEIRTLLEKYYRGETSLKEEKMLRDQFLSGDYPPEFSVEAGPFLCFAKAAKEWVPDPELDREIQKILHALPASVAWRRKKRIPWLVAVSVIMLAGLVFTMRETVSKIEAREKYAQTFENMEETMGKLNTRFAQTNQLEHLTGKSKSVNSISSLYNVQQSINTKTKPTP